MYERHLEGNPSRPILKLLMGKALLLLWPAWSVSLKLSPQCLDCMAPCGPLLVSSTGDAGCSESGLEVPEC